MSANDGKADEAENVAGRPTDYDAETCDAICERLCDGESLRSICSDDAMPNRATVFRWLLRHDEFRDQYACAREIQADAFVDEIIDIADDGSNDWMEKSFGEDIRWVENGEALRRSQLRVDARKWLASKLKAKKYGDLAKLELTGKDGGPIQTAPITLPPEEQAALSAWIENVRADIKIGGS